MSYSFQFGIFSKKQNSTKRPTSFPDTQWKTINNVLFKNGSSLINPVVTVNAKASDFKNFNYAVFDSKYYFITEKIALRNDLLEIHLKLDGLATFKTNITGSTQYVCYSSVYGNQNWLADTRIPVLKNTTTHSNSVTLPFFIDGGGGWYILSVIGKSGSCLYALAGTHLKALIASIDVSNDDFLTDSAARNNEIWQGTGIVPSAEESLYYFSTVATQNDILGKAYGQAPGCIRSCLFVPFGIDGTTDEEIWLGNYNTHVRGVVVDGSPITGSTSVTIPWTYSDWRRGYCEQVYLYLPLVGMVNLSSDNLTHATTIEVNYSYTITDGTVAYQLVSGGEIIGSYGGSCAINYPLGINQQASAGEVTQAILQGMTQTVSAGLTGNVMGTIGGIMNMSYNALSTAMTSHPSCVGGIGGGAGSGLSHDITCYTVTHETVVEPSAMRSTMGVPTMKAMLLASCSGYCQCANAHVALNAPLEVTKEIDAYLNTGFYIE